MTNPTTTLDALVQTYHAWLEEREYTPTCAMELHAELLCTDGANQDDVAWLERFLADWERLEQARSH